MNLSVIGLSQMRFGVSQEELKSIVEAQTKGAEIKGISTETEKGKTLYEAETRLNGHGRDLLFDKTGTLVEVEEETALDAITAHRAMGTRRRSCITASIRYRTKTL